MTGRRCVWVLLAGLALGAWTTPLEGQVRWNDLVITLGGSGERYSGNFSAVTVPIVDSTDHATAAVGELGVRGSLYLLEEENGTRSLELSFDAGMRQAAAVGFELRDYAPREWVGEAALELVEGLGSWGSLILRGGARSRAVSDRPPMPLFLQPGYTTGQASAELVTRALQGVSLDLRADLETADYRALELVPQLDLLDRRGAGVELGARWGSQSSNLRVFGGLRWTEYRQQGSFDPADPFRRDRTTRVGADWTHVSDVVVQLGVEGALNRSNSNRPEYDAVSLSGLFTAPLPRGFSLNAFAVLTAKSYLQETDFARLVPGEEADNASIAFVQLGRALAANLDGAVRLGWTRAETDIGSAYYQRFGVSVLFNYRPLR